MLVALMAEDARLAEQVAACGIIAEFQHPEWRRAAEALATAPRDADRVALVQELPRALRDRVARRLLVEADPGAAAEERERALADCIAAIRRRRQRGAVRRLREEIRAAEARGDAGAVADGMRRLKTLMDAEHTEKVST
jgi:hypothetical protein